MVSTVPSRGGRRIDVDLRLLRMPGRADLALLILTWPGADGPPGPGADVEVAEHLRRLAPSLAELAAAGDISDVVVVARTDGLDLDEIEIDGLGQGEDLGTLLRMPGVTPLVVLDGVLGEQADALARGSQRLALSRRQPDPGLAGAERWDEAGTAVIDAAIARMRATGEPALDAEGGPSSAQGLAAT